MSPLELIAADDTGLLALHKLQDSSWLRTMRSMRWYDIASAEERLLESVTALWHTSGRRSHGYYVELAYDDPNSPVVICRPNGEMLHMISRAMYDVLCRTKANK